MPLPYGNWTANATQAWDQTNLFRGHHAATRAGSAAGADLGMSGHIHLPDTLVVRGLGSALLVLMGAGLHLLIALWRRPGGGSGPQPSRPVAA